MKNRKFLSLTLVLCILLGLIFNVSTTYASDTYIKGPITPKHLYVINQDKLTSHEKTIIATLQGIVATKSTSQIYTLTSQEPDYSIWLNDLKNNYNVQYETVDDPWKLVEIFKSYIDGYILYSNSSSKDPSINNACTLASLKNSIAIDESLETKVKSIGITTKIGDCRNTNSSWAFDNLWNKGLNHSTVIQLEPGKASPLRDYALVSKSLIFYEDSVSTTTLRDKIFAATNPNSICLGWGPDEFENVSIASKYGVSIVAADWSYNLSTLSSFPSNPLTQKPSAKTADNNVHYVTFIMSDGDNQQWTLGANYASPKWYGSPNRGSFNMGWTLTPSMYYLAPTVMKLYYQSASSGEFKDNFLVSPSGNGYMYPSKYNPTMLEDYTKTLNSYMKNVDQKHVVILDDNALYKKDIWNSFTSKPNVDGLFYLDYHKHDNYHGEIVFSNNKPIVSCRDLLWNGLQDEDQLVEKINSRVLSGLTNTTSPDAYTFVYVHAWSKDMSNVKSVIDKLNQNPKIRIVTPDNFMNLIKTNIKG